MGVWRHRSQRPANEFDASLEARPFHARNGPAAAVIEVLEEGAADIFDEAIAVFANRRSVFPRGDVTQDMRLLACLLACLMEMVDDDDDEYIDGVMMKILIYGDSDGERDDGDDDVDDA